MWQASRIKETTQKSSIANEPLTELVRNEEFTSSVGRFYLQHGDKRKQHPCPFCSEAKWDLNLPLCALQVDFSEQCLAKQASQE